MNTTCCVCQTFDYSHTIFPHLFSKVDGIETRPFLLPPNYHIKRYQMKDEDT